MQTESQATRQSWLRPIVAAAVIALAAIVAFIAFGHGGKSAVPQADAVQVAGSETMRAAVSACAEDFMNRNPRADIVVRGGGSGDGVAALLHGIIDIGMTSRELTQRERDYARTKKLELAEFPLALDGIAVVVHRDNPLAALDLAQLHDVFAGRIRNWRELQGADSEITVFARAPGSGTASLFGTRVLGQDSYGTSVQHLPTNDAIVSQVATRPAAIGYADLGALRTGGDRVRVIALRGPDAAPVAARPDDIRAGHYPLARTLWLTTAGAPSGAAKAFIDHCLSAGGQALLQKAGYVGAQPIAR